METTSGSTHNAGRGLERLGWGCLWIVLNPLWIILLSVAAYLGWNSWQASQHGASVTGTVVSMRQVSPTRQGGVSTYAPSISYSVNGQSYTYHSSNSSFPPAFEVGEKVELVYRQDDPSDARIDSWSALWLLPALFGGAGVIVAAVAVPLTLYSIKRRGRSRRDENAGVDH